MTDRKLLEAAARAAGIPYIKPLPEYNGRFGLEAGSENPMRTQTWNPLADDGDALRLAVRLGIAFKYDRNAPPELKLPRECATAITDKGQWFAEVGRDELAATRRAIVRAAAAMGGAE